MTLLNLPDLLIKRFGNEVRPWPSDKKNIVVAGGEGNIFFVVGDDVHPDSQRSFKAFLKAKYWLDEKDDPFFELKIAGVSVGYEKGSHIYEHHIFPSTRLPSRLGTPNDMLVTFECSVKLFIIDLLRTLPFENPRYRMEEQDGRMVKINV